MEAQQSRPIRYKLVCEQNVFCYRHVRSYVKANYPKSLPFALKVARYSFPGPVPPKFEHKLRRHKQSFEKNATTVVLDKDENLL